MAPRSPTMAFDPTPALEHDSGNYSPLNHFHSAMFSHHNHNAGSPKEVRFANSSNSSTHRAHSIATDNVPLLPQIPSASTIPRTSFRITEPPPGIDFDAYIENCRNLNEQLRTAQEAERKTWSIERSSLKAKIAELEFQLNRIRDKKRASSNEPSRYGRLRLDSRSVFPIPSATTAKTDDPAEPAPFLAAKSADAQPPPARVFNSEDTLHDHLSNTAESDIGSPLTKEISPTSAHIPVEQVVPTLDGIVLKSGGLTSSFTTKIASPTFGSPSRSTSPGPTPGNLQMTIDTSTLIPALDEKLKLNAGHTPMNFDGADPSDVTTQIPTPVAENPPAPAPTARPPLRPSENSHSYFSQISDMDIREDRRIDAIVEEAEPTTQFEPENDKPLQEPLMLDAAAKTSAADRFLSSVDAKLRAAVKEVSPTRHMGTASADEEPVTLPATALQALEQASEASKPRPKETDDEMPQLKLKKSMNFGSAYGSSMPGFR